MHTETVSINGKLETIEYKQVHIGDIIYDKNSNSTYIADIDDADDLAWVVISK